MREFKTIEELDLDPIKVKLMHKESGEGWSLEHASAVEKQYRRFMVLMKKYPEEQAAPLVDVDTFWHYHILDTMKYAVDCEAVFGYFLHHFPYIGLRGETDLAAHHRLGERMKELYEETFDEAYLRDESGDRAPGQAAVQTAWSAKVVGTAWSARAPMKAGIAWSASPASTGVAWSASPAKAGVAWSASPAKAGAAWSASPAKAGGTPGLASAASNVPDPLFTARPRLPQSAA
jgi:hypothetical protein